MVQIIEEAPSFSQQLGRGLGANLAQFGGGLLKGHIENKEKLSQQKAQAAEAQSIMDQFGIDLSQVRDPKMREQIFKEAMKSQGMSFKEQLKQQEKLAPIQQGLETIKRQRERLASGMLGPKIRGINQPGKFLESISNEGRKIRAGYEQAGKELIQLASTLPIKNEKEFNVLADKLYDPTLNEAEIEGVLDEMERHLITAMESHGQKRSGEKQNSLEEIFK